MANYAQFFVGQVVGPFTVEVTQVKARLLRKLLMMFASKASYKVSQQVWDTLRNDYVRSERIVYKKMYSAPKICFLAFFVNCKK